MGLDLDYIYGQTPLDQEELDELRIKSITLKSELNEFEQLNIEKAVEWSMSRKLSCDEILSEQFIKKLHFNMFNDVWKWAGKYRMTEKTLGAEPHHIPLKLRELIDNCKYWIEHQTYGEDEISIRFKFYLVRIHLFANGNGRHSRLMADIISVKCFQREVFSWGSASLYETGDSRRQYLEAIYSAEKSNFNPLIKFART